MKMLIRLLNHKDILLRDEDDFDLKEVKGFVDEEFNVCDYQ